jgi:hypothetical protein
MRESKQTRFATRKEADDAATTELANLTKEHGSSFVLSSVVITNNNDGFGYVIKYKLNS